MTRRETILDLRAQGLTWEDVGRSVGKTGQRAGQIALYGEGMTPTNALAHARRADSAAKRAKAQAKAAAAIPSAPPPIDWSAVRAEQAAKPASERWPYAQPALVERVWQSREPTFVATGSTLS